MFSSALGGKPSFILLVICGQLAARVSVSHEAHQSNPDEYFAYTLKMYTQKRVDKVVYNFQVILKCILKIWYTPFT